MPLLRYRSPAIGIAIAASVLSACGGGGGGSSAPPPPPTFSVNPTSVSFSAASPLSATPAPATVVGTITGSGTLSGTLYITIVEPSGPSSPIDSVSNVTISGNSGTASITPKSPDMIGVGTATGTIAVHACMNDPTCATGELAGSP
jgi:hypothetical protein